MLARDSPTIVRGDDMHTQFIMQLRENLIQNGVSFCYCGYVTEEILTSIGEVLRDKLALENIERQVSRDVFTIFVEQVQNIIRYSAEKQEGELEERSIDLRHGILAVGQNERNEFYVTCSNAIADQDASRLKNSLDHLRSLDKQGLKALHREILKGKTPEGSKGAGVGFIDIARLATRGFDYEFLPIGENLSYFILKAYL